MLNNKWLKIGIIGVIILIICFFVYKLLDKDPIVKPKEVEVSIPKYELILTKVDYLDSLLKVDNKIIESLKGSIQKYKQSYEIYVKERLDTNRIVDSSLLLIEITRFTDN